MELPFGPVLQFHPCLSLVAAKARPQHRSARWCCRQLTHRSFTSPKWVEYALAYLGTLGLEHDPIEWVKHHRYHHQNTDTPLDPHSEREHCILPFFILAAARAVHFLPSSVSPHRVQGALPLAIIMCTVAAHTWPVFWPHDAFLSAHPSPPAQQGRALLQAQAAEGSTPLHQPQIPASSSIAPGDCGTPDLLQARTRVSGGRTTAG